MTVQNLFELPATELLARYRDRSLSPVDVVRSVLDRMAAWEPGIHATYALDEEAAMASARASERRWTEGAPSGALDGVPITLKENIATRGTPTPLGSAATVLVPAAHDAPAAARVREAGAVIVAKATMPDFGLLGAAASSFHPLTHCPSGSRSSAAASTTWACCRWPISTNRLAVRRRRGRAPQ